MLKNDTADYDAENVHFDTLKGIKIHRLLPVELELWDLASKTALYYKYREKFENYTFVIKSSRLSNGVRGHNCMVNQISKIF